MKKTLLKNKKSEGPAPYRRRKPSGSGFVILFAVTLAAIMLSIALGVSNIVYKEIKFTTSVKDTSNAFYAADTGVECALINDRNSNSVFLTSESPQITCNNTSITALKDSIFDIWSFSVPGLGSDGTSCARVTVDKTDPLLTTVTSTGRSRGDNTCLTNDFNIVERELEVSYGSNIPPETTPVFIGSSGTNGRTLDFDIGTPGGNRLVVVIASDESKGINLSSVTADGKNCDLVRRAENIEGSGNHTEMWYCDENHLGNSSGTVPITLNVGDAGTAIHALLFSGVGQSGPTDSGIDESSAGINTITPSSIEVPQNGLVVAAWADGSGSKSINSQTSPLSPIQNEPPPGGGADLFTSAGIETEYQANKTYAATLIPSTFNRATGIVASWPVLSTPYTPTSSISFVGSNSATGTSVSIPSHQAGDLIVIFAYRDGSVSPPLLASGYSDIGTADGAFTTSSRLAYKIATSNGDTSGTWAGATSLVVNVYRGQNSTPIGANGNTGASSSTVTYPGISLNKTNGTSWVVGFAGHRAGSSTLENPPSGMINRTFVGTNEKVAGHDTNQGVSSWSATNVSVGTSSGWRARTVEILSN